MRYLQFWKAFIQKIPSENYLFRRYLKVLRPTGIELVSSAPQADTLSIELWARKSVI